MLDLRAFAGEVVRADRAHRVVTPPYDALTPEAREALAATDPDSYLGVLPPGGTVGDEGALDAALTRCRTHLDRLVAAGRYRPIDGPAVGVLEFGSGPQRAVAVVGDVPVAAFTDGRVLPHERVAEARVDELARYLEVVGVASSPVALTQRPDPDVTAATAEAIAATVPDVAYRADDGTDIALRCVTDHRLRDRLCTAVDHAGVAFVADGHHRAAAAARFARTVGAGSGDRAGRVLCAVLPTDHLAVLPFHRRIEGAFTSDDEVEAFRQRLHLAGVTVTPLEGPATPARRHAVTMTAGGRWWHLDVEALARDDDVVEALDVRLVDRDLLPRLPATGPTAGPAAEPAAVPIASPLGLSALHAPGAIGFALHPPAITEVLAVAEAGRTLPPKTTYVTPKLRSGLVVTPRPRPSPPRRA